MFAKAHLPTATVAAYAADDAISVRIDDRQAAYEMSRHLLDLGPAEAIHRAREASQVEHPRVAPAPLQVQRQDLPAHLRHGIYAEPRTYPAWVRFSGPGPYITPDIEDVGFMSISIKLMGVPGKIVQRLVDTGVSVRAGPNAP